MRLAQGDLAGAGDIFKAALVIARDLYRKHPDKNSQVLLAQCLGNLSYALLLGHQYKGAIAAAEEALALDPSLIALYTNQAHGYLLTGQFDQAQAIYRAHAQERVCDGQTFAGAVLDDFAKLRQRGIDHPDMKRIEALLKPGGKPTEATNARKDVPSGNRQ